MNITLCPAAIFAHYNLKVYEPETASLTKHVARRNFEEIQLHYSCRTEPQPGESVFGEGLHTWEPTPSICDRGVREYRPEGTSERRVVRAFPSVQYQAGDGTAREVQGQPEDVRAGGRIAQCTGFRGCNTSGRGKKLKELVL